MISPTVPIDVAREQDVRAVWIRFARRQGRLSAYSGRQGTQRAPFLPFFNIRLARSMVSKVFMETLRCCAAATRPEYSQNISCAMEPFLGASLRRLAADAEPGSQSGRVIYERFRLLFCIRQLNPARCRCCSLTNPPIKSPLTLRSGAT